MARFDVFKNEKGAGYLLDVQSDLLEGLNTRVVVPLLLRSEAPKPAQYLNPLFTIDGEVVVMATQFMAAVPVGELKTVVGRLEKRQQEISSALDMLFLGF